MVHRTVDGNMQNLEGNPPLRFNDTVWEDLRVPMQNTVLTPAKSEPEFENVADGLYAYAFDHDNDADESLHFVVQLPHAYKVGSNLRFHVHWAPSTTNTGNVVWELEYSASAINGTFPSSTSIEKLDAADGTALKHQISSFAEIDGSSLGMSSMLICRLTRLGDDGTDTFTGVAYALEADFHIELDQMGSSEEFVK